MCVDFCCVLYLVVCFVFFFGGLRCSQFAYLSADLLIISNEHSHLHKTIWGALRSSSETHIQRQNRNWHGEKKNAHFLNSVNKLYEKRKKKVFSLSLFQHFFHCHVNVVCSFVTILPKHLHSLLFSSFRLQQKPKNSFSTAHTFKSVYVIFMFLFMRWSHTKHSKLVNIHFSSCNCSLYRDNTISNGHFLEDAYNF